MCVFQEGSTLYLCVFMSTKNMIGGLGYWFDYLYPLNIWGYSRNFWRRKSLMDALISCSIFWRVLFFFTFLELIFSGGHKYKKKFHCLGATKIWFFFRYFHLFHWNRYWTCCQKLKNTQSFFFFFFFLIISIVCFFHAWIKRIKSKKTENICFIIMFSTILKKSHLF